MRASGSVDSARSLGPRDHVCCVYEDHADVLAAMVEFLGECRASDQRVQYVARGDRAAQHRHVDGLDGADGTAGGPVPVLPVDDVYEPGETVGPEAQVAAYRAATEQALADGFTGLRVAAEATPPLCGLAALDEEAGRHFTSTIVLNTPLSTSRRLVELLDLGAVRLEAPV